MTEGAARFARVLRHKTMATVSNSPLSLRRKRQVPSPLAAVWGPCHTMSGLFAAPAPPKGSSFAPGSTTPVPAGRGRSALTDEASVRRTPGQWLVCARQLASAAGGAGRSKGLRLPIRGRVRSEESVAR